MKRYQIKTENYETILFKKNIQEINENDILNLNKSDIYNFAHKTFNSIINNNYNSVKYEKTLEIINYHIDNIIEDEIETFNKFYKLSILKFLSEYSYFINQNNRYNKYIDDLINNNDNISKILITLYKNGSLTNSELAKKMQITPNNLSNTLKKLSATNNVITSYKNDNNQKNVYYSLTLDCKKTIKKNNKLKYHQQNNYQSLNKYEMKYALKEDF